MNALIILVAMVAVIGLIDYIPRFFNAVKRPILVPKRRTRIPEYRILPTVYGDISYLQNASFLKRYRRSVVICTSLYETEEFYAELEKVCAKYALSYVCVDVPKTPSGQPIRNAYTIYQGVLADPQQIGADASTPCLLIDADTVSNDNVNDLARAFIANKCVIASLRCEVLRPQTVIEHLQAYEYKTAMDNRRMDPWLTSGACTIGRAGVLQHVYSRHSNFFDGGDIEIGKLATTMGYQMSHIHFTFLTAAPNTWKRWFVQRIMWTSGGIRHHVINMGNFSWHHFFILFYNTLLVYLLFPLRWIELVHAPYVLGVLLAVAWIYTVAVIGIRQWKWVYLVLPVYAFVQSMFVLPFAVVRYIRLAWRQRSLGLLRQDLSHLGIGLRAVNKALNVSTAVMVLVIAGLLTTTRIEYWAALPTPSHSAVASR